MKQSTNYGFNIPEPNDALDIEVIGQTIEQIDKKIKEGEIYHCLDILNQSDIIAIVKADETVPINATKLLMIGSDTELRTTLDNDTCVAMKQSISNNDGGTMSILIGENVPELCRGKSIWNIAIDGEIDDSNYAVFLMESVKDYVIKQGSFSPNRASTLYYQEWKSGKLEVWGTYLAELYGNAYDENWFVSEFPICLKDIYEDDETVITGTIIIHNADIHVRSGYTVSDEYKIMATDDVIDGLLIGIYSPISEQKTIRLGVHITGKVQHVTYPTGGLI